MLRRNSNITKRKIKVRSKFLSKKRIEIRKFKLWAKLETIRNQREAINHWAYPLMRCCTMTRLGQCAVLHYNRKRWCNHHEQIRVIKWRDYHIINSTNPEFADWTEPKKAVTEYVLRLQYIHEFMFQYTELGHRNHMNDLVKMFRDNDSEEKYLVKAPINDRFKFYGSVFDIKIVRYYGPPIPEIIITPMLTPEEEAEDKLRLQEEELQQIEMDRLNDEFENMREQDESQHDSENQTIFDYLGLMEIYKNIDVTDVEDWD